MHDSHDQLLAHFEKSFQPSTKERCSLETEIGTFGRERDFPECLRYRLELIIDELVTNTMVHGGCCGNSHNVTIHILEYEKEIVIELMDTGPPFDLANHPAPQPCTGTEPVGIGKAGLCLVRNLVRDIKYRRTEDGNYHTLFLNK